MLPEDAQVSFSSNLMLRQPSLHQMIVILNRKIMPVCIKDVLAHVNLKRKFVISQA